MSMIDRFAQHEGFRRFLREDIQPDLPPREMPKHSISHLPFAIPKKKERGDDGRKEKPDA